MIAACRECNAKVSTEAANCPHCGVPCPQGGWTSILENEPASVPKERPLAPVIVERLHAQRLPQRPSRKIFIRTKTSGFKFGFGLGCGLIAASVLVPAIVLFVLFGGLGLILSGKKPIEVKPSVEIKEPLTQKIVQSIEEAEEKKKQRLGRLESHYLFGLAARKDGAYSYGVSPELLHKREDCSLYVEALKSYKPLSVIVRQGRFVDEEGFFRDNMNLCDRCVE